MNNHRASLVKREQANDHHRQTISQYPVQNPLVIIILPCPPCIQATANEGKHQRYTLLPREKKNVANRQKKNTVKRVTNISIETSSVKLRWKRFRRFCIVRGPPLKQGKPES